MCGMGYYRHPPLMREERDGDDGQNTNSVNFQKKRIKDKRNKTLKTRIQGGSQIVKMGKNVRILCLFGAGQEFVNKKVYSRGIGRLALGYA